MNHKYIIANWKENKTPKEAISWLEKIAENLTTGENKEVILCPSFALLPVVSEVIKRLNLPIKLGSQDFPAFEEGSYTGEESPRLLKEFVSYTIIGHSERRNHFGESDELLREKVDLAMKYDIKTIFCVQDAETPLAQNVSIVAYEPVFAIGTGNPDTPENAQSVSKEISEKANGASVIYGGSISEENVSSFMQKDDIHGVLVGSKSLDPDAFSAIISRA